MNLIDPTNSVDPSNPIEQYPNGREVIERKRTEGTPTWSTLNGSKRFGKFSNRE